MDFKKIERAAIPFTLLVAALLLAWKLSSKSCTEKPMFYLQGTSLDCDP
jgi:hypothetical protein